MYPIGYVYINIYYKLLLIIINPNIIICSRLPDVVNTVPIHTLSITNTLRDIAIMNSG
jgi:hypothetical protein